MYVNLLFLFTYTNKYLAFLWRFTHKKNLPLARDIISLQYCIYCICRCGSNSELLSHIFILKQKAITGF